MNKLIARCLLVLLAGCVAPIVANSQLSDPVQIPAFRRLPLEVSIPVSKSRTTRLKLWESEDSQCWIQLGPLDPIRLDLRGPCDVQTKGPSSGFSPLVRFNEKDDTPSDVSFEIVGELKYFPQIRGECGRVARTVTLKWVGNPREGLSPTVRTDSIPIAESTAAPLRCTRAYLQIK